jgi:deoxyribonuclease-4
MYFGCHVSVAGGLQNAPLNAKELGCEVFQFFSRSPQGGPAPKITPEMSDAFAQHCKDGGFKEWVIHTPYYINFASELEKTRMNSIRIVCEELERATLLGATYVMFHPGSAGKGDRDQALTWTIEGIKKIYDGYNGSATLLLEISAGAGAVIGASFEEVAQILDGVDQPEMGVCFDTAHAFASGYDLRTKKTVDETFSLFDQLIGLKRLKMSHCNDSKVELGARKDRHEHLGKGFIGVDGFQAMIAHPKLQHMNFYLETEHDAVVEDLKILKHLRG